MFWLMLLMRCNKFFTSLREFSVNSRNYSADLDFRGLVPNEKSSGTLSFSRSDFLRQDEAL